METQIARYPLIDSISDPGKFFYWLKKIFGTTTYNDLSSFYASRRIQEGVDETVAAIKDANFCSSKPNPRRHY